MIRTGSIAMRIGRPFLADILQRGRPRASVPEADFPDDQRDESDGVEVEADAFARKLSYGKGGMESILASPPTTEAEVKSLTAALDLHTGIIVGALRHRRALHSVSRLNTLKAQCQRVDLDEQGPPSCMTPPAVEVMTLQRPLPDRLREILARGAKQDE